ncbi:MAG: hypothetical protein Q9210_007199, partial [Variospora velana]
YWGTLLFPANYPFAPPSIRMHTPSGRFQPSTRLCLSISDFHPKSFNPAWEVSTILIGLMSFMTSDEMTTGSVRASESERRYLAARTRWWNSTGGGSRKEHGGSANKGVVATTKGVGAVKAGDGGVKFRAEWAELDEANWKWMEEHRVDPATGNLIQKEGEEGLGAASCSKEVAALARGPNGTGSGLGSVVGGGHALHDAGNGWLRRHKVLLIGMVVAGVVLLNRTFGEGGSSTNVLYFTDQAHVQQLIVPIGRLIHQPVPGRLQRLGDFPVRIGAILVPHRGVHGFDEIGGGAEGAPDGSPVPDEFAGDVGVEPDAVHADCPEDLQAKDDVEGYAGETPTTFVSMKAKDNDHEGDDDEGSVLPPPWKRFWRESRCWLNEIIVGFGGCPQELGFSPTALDELIGGKVCTSSSRRHHAVVFLAESSRRSEDGGMRGAEMTRVILRRSLSRMCVHSHDDRGRLAHHSETRTRDGTISRIAIQKSDENYLTYQASLPSTVHFRLRDFTGRLKYYNSHLLLLWAVCPPRTPLVCLPIFPIMASAVSDTQQPIKWSSQLSVLPAGQTPLLRGDKIILPPSALEQLLSAATVTVASAASQTSTFDSFNPYSYAAERHAREQIQERRQDLPHPLTFRLVSPSNGRVCYAGIREFSAEEGSVGLSDFLRHSLGVDQQSGIEDAKTSASEAAEHEVIQASPHERLTVHIETLPKGTYVRLRPLEAGYDPEDWKSLLEKHLRDTFTTLTNGEILTVASGREEFRFLVDDLKPNNRAISLVDTDLEVDIEALNEEQARETLKKRVEKAKRAPGTAEGSSPGGLIQADQDLAGQVRPGEFVDYTIEVWDKTKDLEFGLSPSDIEQDIDLFVTPTGPTQRAKPREDEYVFADFSPNPSKRIKITHTNVELDNADAIWVSVRGYEYKDFPQSNEPIRYKLHISSTLASTADQDSAPLLITSPSNPDEEICSNCHQAVPTRTMFLHQNFCLRNNITCPHCNLIFLKTSPTWKNHWHCPHDASHGTTPASR